MMDCTSDFWNDNGTTSQTVQLDCPKNRRKTHKNCRSELSFSLKAGTAGTTAKTLRIFLHVLGFDFSERQRNDSGTWNDGGISFNVSDQTRSTPEHGQSVGMRVAGLRYLDISRLMEPAQGVRHEC